MDMAPAKAIRFRSVNHDAQKVSPGPMPCRTESVRHRLPVCKSSTPSTKRQQGMCGCGISRHVTGRRRRAWRDPLNRQAKQTRAHRTIVVDFTDDATYFSFLDQRQAFGEFVLAFLLALGFQLKQKKDCQRGSCFTRHSHDVRARLNGLPLWRVQCMACKAVFTVLPHFVLRYRAMRPEVAKQALLATHGGLSLELCAVLYNVSPMAIYRVVCACGRQGMVSVLRRCGLPLPGYVLAEEKQSHCRAAKVSLPPMVNGRLIWHLGYTTDKSAVAFVQSYGGFRQAALGQDSTYEVRGILTEGFERTRLSLRHLFPQARLGSCWLHAVMKLPAKLSAISSTVRQGLSHQCATLLFRSRQRQGLRVFALGQKLRHFAKTVATTAGAANGVHVRQWFQDKKAGWYAVLADPQMPPTTTLLDQAHNAIDRKLFMMKGFHHPDGSQQAFLNGLALLYNLVPSQRRAKHAGQCGVEVEGGKLPTRDWFLNLQILTSGGFQ